MKNKKIIVIGLILIEVISCFLMYKSSHNRITKLDDVKLKENNKNSMFAIMVKNSKGEYEEYTKGNTFPTTNDGYIFSKASCMDNTGKEIEGIVTANGDSIVVEGTTTAYCVIYFDLCSIPDKGFASTNQITSCPVGGMYRYQGTNNVNNWICFGADEETCNTPSTASNYDEIVDKYMYRIIGVTPEGQLKLIKETFVKEGTITNFQWHNLSTTADCGTDGSKCTWPKSRIFNRINGYCGTSKDLSESDNKCSGSISGTSGDTNIFIGNSYYEYLQNNTWLNKIEDYEWKYGNLETPTGESYRWRENGDNVYVVENAWSKKNAERDSAQGEIEAKISLMYMYDYLYSYPGGNLICYYDGEEDICEHSWISFRKDGYNTSSNWEFLISRSGIGYKEHSVWMVHYEDGTSGTETLAYDHAIRPVFYLKSDVEILGGTGEKTSPYYLQEGPNLVDLCEDYSDMGTCMENKENDIGSIANLTQDTPGGIHRYQGTDNVNNWICFGTTENCGPSDELVDKYMYRIIGITSKGQLKLVKETFIKEETTSTPNAINGVIQGSDGKYYQTYFQWHNISSKNDCGTNSSKCTWIKSRMFNRLNGYCGTNNDLSESDNKCTGETSGTEGDSNIFIGNSYYNYLQNNVWLSKIADHEWKYGDLKISSGSYNGDTMYTIENGFTTNETSKIGFIYLHDYYYAYPGEESISSAQVVTSWIHYQKDGYNQSLSIFETAEWTITRGGSTSWPVSARSVGERGNLSQASNILNDKVGSRPVFYLNNAIQITGGNGSKTNPYIIKQ